MLCWHELAPRGGYVAHQLLTRCGDSGPDISAKLEAESVKKLKIGGWDHAKLVTTTYALTSLHNTLDLVVDALKTGLLTFADFT